LVPSFTAKIARLIAALSSVTPSPFAPYVSIGTPPEMTGAAGIGAAAGGGAGCGAATSGAGATGAGCGAGSTFAVVVGALVLAAAGESITPGEVVAGAVAVFMPALELLVLAPLAAFAVWPA